jgi:hypothetical protein
MRPRRGSSFHPCSPSPGPGRNIERRIYGSDEELTLRLDPKQPTEECDGEGLLMEGVFENGSWKAL